MIIHTAERLIMGIVIAALFALLLPSFSPVKALFAAAGFTWLVGILLPFAVVVQWGLFPWSLAAKLWAWSAAELLIAAAIVRSIYN